METLLTSHTAALSQRVEPPIRTQLTTPGGSVEKPSGPDITAHADPKCEVEVLLLGTVFAGVTRKIEQFRNRAALALLGALVQVLAGWALAADL